MKGSGLIDLAQENLRQPSVQAVVLVLLVAFRQMYSENLEQKK